MRESIQALMTGLIDYAGLFPPAELDRDSAMREYARHRRGVDRWMLGSFVVPVGRLGDLAAYGETHLHEGPPWEFVVLPRGGETDVLARSLTEDTRAIDEFEKYHGGRVRVSALEMRIPAAIAEDEGRCQGWMDILAGAMGRRALPVFVEPVRGEGWEDALTHASGAVARIRDSVSEPSFGMKLRCGGVTPAAFPSVEEVAQFLLQCHRWQVPVKATAGLHHPLRHRHDPLGVDMHGFVNVFASALFVARGLEMSELLELLDERNPGAFSWDDESFTWRRWSLPAHEVRELRRRRIGTFGSCSFDEPCADLRELGWLQ